MCIELACAIYISHFKKYDAISVKRTTLLKIKDSLISALTVINLGADCDTPIKILFHFSKRESL